MKSLYSIVILVLIWGCNESSTSPEENQVDDNSTIPIDTTPEIQSSDYSTATISYIHSQEELLWIADTVYSIGDDVWADFYVEGLNDSTVIAFYLKEGIEPGTYQLNQEYEFFHGIRFQSYIDGELNFWSSSHSSGPNAEERSFLGTGYFDLKSIQFTSYGTISSIEAEFEMHAINFATGKTDSIHITQGRLGLSP